MAPFLLLGAPLTGLPHHDEKMLNPPLSYRKKPHVDLLYTGNVHNLSNSPTLLTLQTL